MVYTAKWLYKNLLHCKKYSTRINSDNKKGDDLIVTF